MKTQSRPGPGFPTIPWRHTRPSRRRTRAFATIGPEHLYRLD